jgi:plastocyanin
MMTLLLRSCGVAVLACASLLAYSVAGTAQARTQSLAYVDMKDHGVDSFAYLPKTLKVRAGTRVIWRNRSSQPHSITPTGGQQAFGATVAKQIDSKHQWSFVFKRPGTYRYYCVFHPYMHGTVAVVR